MNVEAVTELISLRTDRDGVVRVAGSRVTLDTLVEAFKEGATPEEMVQQYPSLDLADVYSVILYYLRHRSEVESYLSQRRQQAEQVRQEVEARTNPVGIRERLLARRRREGP